MMIEVDDKPISFVQKIIESEKDYHEIIVITSQATNSITQMNLFVYFRDYTNKNNLKFLQINLDEKR